MDYAHRVKPDEKVELSDFDAGEHRGLSREEAETRTAELASRMEGLLELLFAAGQHALLVVLQGRDTSGKDGTIRHILNFTNVQTTRVAPFKAPTSEELSHDFLWRVHAQTPGRGGFTIFNRSHYEDVLVVRVHNLVPDDVWKGRYKHINAFEALLADSDTILLKFFLHVSKDEQERRLLERENETEKAWKLSVGDWQERELWGKYEEAYEDALTKCSTPRAPWFLVPANHKWFRNLAVTEQIVQALEPYRDQWETRLKQMGAAAKKELTAYRASHKS